MTYHETNVLMGVDSQGSRWQRYSKSEASPGDGRKFTISTDGSISLRTGVESNASIGLSV